MKQLVPNILLAAAVAALPFCAQAQSYGNINGLHGHNNYAPGRRHGMMPFNAAKAGTANKTTASGSRLLAYTEHNGTSPQDSSTYSYTGTMGGYLSDQFGFAYWQWNFDVRKEYSYNTATSSYDPYPTGGQQNTQAFDISNNLLSSVWQGWDGGTSTWVNEDQNTYTYNTMNFPVTSLYQYWISGAWVNEDSGINTFSGSLYTAYLSLQWNTSTSSWDSSEKWAYTYDGLNQIIEETGQRYSTGTWANSYKSTYTYDGSGNQLTELDQSWDSTSSTWVNTGITTNTGFAGHQPLVSTIQNWDPATSTFVNATLYTTTYNSYDQPVSRVQQNWNTTTSAWDNVNTEHYYYEPYAASVKNINSSNGKAEIYPVPASSTLSVSVTWDAPQAFTVSITDMLGKVCSTWNVPECGQYTKSVSVANLPVGNYIINMEGANGKITQQLTVTR